MPDFLDKREPTTKRQLTSRTGAQVMGGEPMSTGEGDKLEALMGFLGLLAGAAPVGQASRAAIPSGKLAKDMLLPNIHQADRTRPLFEYFLKSLRVPGNAPFSR